MMQPLSFDIDQIITAALAEDLGKGDVTTQLLVPETLRGHLRFMAREPLIACGAGLIGRVFTRLSADVIAEGAAQDGAFLQHGDCLLEVRGPARALLTGERVALNLLQRMCAVATLTAKYVKAVEGTGAGIYDTRKTMPGLRMLDKYAVTAGGGHNHRLRLDDGILIKDNHIALCGSVAAALAKAKAGGGTLPVQVECDTLDQMREALDAGADMILLDNMPLDMLREAVQENAGRVPLEASGNVSLETVRAIAETGVDRISVGRITHSAPNVDIGLDVALS